MSCMTRDIELMTTSEVAQALRVDSSTVRRWAATGAIAAVRLPNGTFRIPRTALDELLAPTEAATPEDSRTLAVR